MNRIILISPLVGLILFNNEREFMFNDDDDEFTDEKIDSKIKSIVKQIIQSNNDPVTNFFNWYETVTNDVILMDNLDKDHMFDAAVQFIGELFPNVLEPKISDLIKNYKNDKYTKC